MKIKIFTISFLFLLLSLNIFANDIACFNLGASIVNTLDTAMNNNLKIINKIEMGHSRFSYTMMNNNEKFYLSNDPVFVNLDFYKNKLFGVVILIKPKNSNDAKIIYTKAKANFFKKYKSVKIAEGYKAEHDNCSYLLKFSPKKNNSIMLIANNIELLNQYKEEQKKDISKIIFINFRLGMNLSAVTQTAKGEKLKKTKDTKKTGKNGIVKTLLNYTGKDYILNTKNNITISLELKNNYLSTIILSYNDLSPKNSQSVFNKLKDKFSSEFELKPASKIGNLQIMQHETSDINFTLLKDKNKVNALLDAQI